MCPEETESRQVRLIKVFISSPGDVADAREVIRRVVDMVNRVLAEHEGVYLKPVGWEDVPSGTRDR